MSVELPMCGLDDAGLAAQLARYREVGRRIEALERRPRRLTVRLAGASAATLDELIRVERDCCPMFEVDWTEPVLSVSVDDPEHEPALDAIEYALTTR